MLNRAVEFEEERLLNKTVEFYETQMDEAIGKLIAQYPVDFHARLSVPINTLRTVRSFSAFSQQYALPLVYFNALIIFGIRHLMCMYRHETGIPPCSFLNISFWVPPDQSTIARQVRNECGENWGQLNFTGEASIKTIKLHLESGLLADNLHPQDNFPLIVKAIANQTAGMEIWEFSAQAVERLNEIETTELRMT